MHSVAGPWVMSGKKCTSGNSLIFTWWEMKEKTEEGRGMHGWRRVIKRGITPKKKSVRRKWDSRKLHVNESIAIKCQTRNDKF